MAYCLQVVSSRGAIKAKKRQLFVYYIHCSMVLHSAQEGSWIKFEKHLKHIKWCNIQPKLVEGYLDNFCLHNVPKKLLSYLTLVPSDIRAYFSIPVFITFRISFFNGCEQENILHVSLNQRQNSDFSRVNQYFFTLFFRI